MEVRDATLEVGERAALHVELATLDEAGSGTGTGPRARLLAPATETGTPPPLDVTAARSTWDLREMRLTFEGEVVAVRGDLRLSCDRLEVRFESPDRIEGATATGAVRVVRGERRAAGARAELDAATGRVVLTGDPTLTDGPNRLSGTRIVLLLDEERIECDACRLLVAGPAAAPR